jgi:NAD(P)-dependent dehydrogenase (short-subunit alcohol dehydrogenase family)/acyl carrier protein
MHAAVAQITARFGAIHGVVHAAGVPGGGLIQLKTPEAVGRVWAPKIEGTLVLDALFRHAALDFLVLCSSTTAIHGEFGQVDYCAANAFLDAIAHSHRARGGPRTISINWGPWREVGMAVDTLAEIPDKLRPWRVAQLEQGISPREGTEALSRILRHGLSQVVVSPQDLASLTAEADALVTAQALTALHGPQSTAETYSRSGRNRPYVPPSTENERRMAGLWEEILGIRPISMEDTFFELGGDSLSALRMVARAKHALNLPLTVEDVYAHPTPRALASTVRGQIKATGP